MASLCKNPQSSYPNHYEQGGAEQQPSDHHQQQQQHQGTQVRNFYETIPKNKDKEKQNPYMDTHHIKIPFRMMIVGASGSMKTNTALDIVEKFADTFYHITVVCRNKTEPLYKLMADSLPEDQFKIIEIQGDDLSDIPKINAIDKKHPSLVIFDDLVLVDDQGPIEEFFIRARKVECSVMYLAQSYFKSPKTIRLNLTHLVLKKIASLNDLSMILRDYTLSIDIDELRHMYQQCTQMKLDWFMIAIDNPPGKQFFHNYEMIDTGEPQQIDPSDSSDQQNQNPQQQQQQDPSSSLQKRHYTESSFADLMGQYMNNKVPKHT